MPDFINNILYVILGTVVLSAAVIVIVAIIRWIFRIDEIVELLKQLINKGGPK